MENAKEEVKIIKDIYKKGMLKMYENFRLGNNYFMVFEKLGPSLSEVMNQYKDKKFSLHDIQAILKNILTELDYLHSKKQLIHTDLKPENILFCESKVINKSKTSRSRE